MKQIIVEIKLKKKMYPGLKENFYPVASSGKGDTLRLGAPAGGVNQSQSRLPVV